MTHPYTRLFTLPAPPDADNDVTEGYEIGDVVHVTGGGVYDCRDAAEGAAVWEERTGGGSAPATTAANDFQVGDGSGNWIKKTLAQTITILRTSLDSVYAAISHSHAWGTITGTLSSQSDLQSALDAKQPLDSDLTAIAGLSPTNDDILQRKAGAWTNRTLAQLMTDLTELIQDLVGGMLSGNVQLNISTTYDDTNGKLDFQIPDEVIQDIVGAMVSSNTETVIAVTYDDTAGKLNFDASHTNGDSVLGSVFNITGTAGTFQDTGLSVTLPAAGTYRVTADVRGSLRANGGAGSSAWWLSAELYNFTDSAVVANSERLIVLTGTNAVLFQMTCTFNAIITVAASKNIKLYACRNGNGTPAWTTSDIESNSAGRTVLSYERIG